MKFYLGAPEPAWLGSTDVPLMVSRRRLNRNRKLPRVLGPWILDSGGFTELDKYGRWTVTAETYVADVRRYRDEIGNLRWAAPQDWMCESSMLVKTGKTVAEHQRLSVDNFLEFRELAPDLPWIPVLQGQTPADYLRHADAYEDADINLNLRIVGLGSVCRRQSTRDIGDVVMPLHARGYRMHGFGMKTLGIKQVGRWLHSSDSQAWSAHARSAKLQLPGCTHQTCNYCLKWALQWRDGIVTIRDDLSSYQQTLGAA